ncbi:MAG: YihA family ribosome biogenesis GTP-binding protein [Eubacterium sp.]|nr:YihA family ribosome biogenesis GTP-binding protein [Eubacterium sp.]
MKIKTSELSGVYGPTSKFPTETLPEIAFAGRSNVGKSSLINSLLNRKNLARTSSSPGKTVTINFYNVNEEFFLVDLPGYGYAKTSLAERAKWGKMIEKYLGTRDSLKALVLLIDIRHAPTKDDVMMFNWVVENGLTPIIVATKLDKIKRSQKDKQLKLLRDTLGIKNDIKIVPYSSETKQGREELLDILSLFL